MKRLNLKGFLVVVVITTGIILSLLNVYKYSSEVTLGADIVSRVLPAVAHRIGIGSPYLDYWEITPPGHYIVLDIWSQFFEYSGFSIKAFYVVVNFGLVIFSYYLLSRFFKGVYLIATAIAIYFLLFSVRLANFILPAETLALFFSLAGVCSLFYFTNPKTAAFISTFLLLFAGQIKDPYLFAILAVIPYIYLLYRDKKDYRGAILFLLLGLASSVTLTLVYLLVMGSFWPYIEVLKAKSLAFDIFNYNWLLNNFLLHVKFVKDIFFLMPLPLITPLFTFVAISIFLKIKNKSIILKIFSQYKIRTFLIKVSYKPLFSEVWIAIFYCLGLLVGFVIQRSLGSHYYIIAVFPIVFLTAVCFYYADQKLVKLKKVNILRLLLLFIFLSFILPEKAYFMDYNFAEIVNLPTLPKKALLANQNQISPLVARVVEKTKAKDCIIDIYGWGVGTTYLYSQRKPCTRYFIINLITAEWQREEYRSNIIKNNPAAIIYNPRSGDQDTDRFEAVVANFTYMIKNCYVVDKNFNTLYFPKYKDLELNNCIVTHIVNNYDKK